MTMNEPSQQQEVKRHELQELLRELVRWSDGSDRDGYYCKLWGGEGVDVAHEEDCPVPDVRQALNVPAADIGVLAGLVMCFMVRGDEDGPDGKVCKLCSGSWVRHHTGCPIMRAWKSLNLKTVFRCLKCGITEERPFYGPDTAQGLCKLCSNERPQGSA